MSRLGGEPGMCETRANVPESRQHPNYRVFARDMVYLVKQYRSSRIAGEHRRVSVRQDGVQGSSVGIG